MSKKIKPVNINDVDVTDGNIPVPSDIAQPAAEIPVEMTTNDALEIKITDSEKIEGLEKTNRELTIENDSLKEKLAEYLEKISVLETSAKTSLSANSIASPDEIDDLRLENDSYLIKISELTFENAKLKAQLEKYSKECHSSMLGNSNAELTPSHSEIPNTQGSSFKQTPRFRPITRQALGGYSDWN